MGTRSFIIQQTATEKGDLFSGIYCHWDGYLEHNGKILLDHYNDAEKLSQLIALGDISVLQPTIGEKQDFNSRERKGTLAYHRDRGEEWEQVKPITSYSIRELISQAKSVGCEFVYTHDGKEWKYAARESQYFGLSDGSSFSNFVDLAPAVERATQQAQLRR